MSRKRDPESTTKRQWRFQNKEAEAPPEPFDGENELGDAWLRLQILHTAFRATALREYRYLIDSFWDIERIFLENEALESYYEECRMTASVLPSPASVTSAARSVPPQGSTPGAEPLKYSRRMAGHVASLQAQLMEDAFYILRLDRYANAPDNHGWMNLFRRWGWSATFNQRFDELRSTFAEEFAQFYDLYLREYPATIDESPIPHPWDTELRRQDPRSSFSVAPPSVARTRLPGSLPGVFLDSGIREVAPDPTAGGGERPVEQPGTGGHGVRDSKGGTQSYEQPPPAAEGGSVGTDPGAAPNA